MLLTVSIVTRAVPATTTNLQVDKQTKEKISGLLVECQKSSHASDADVQLIKDKKMPSTHEGLCMMECVFEAAKIMKDGRFNKVSTVQALAGAMKGDQGKIKKLGELADTCDKEVGKGNNDKCITAKMVLECVQKHGKDSGFQLPMH